ncbi:MAG TPA: nucleotidyltransferase family protein, partial [Actinocrinis sp.]|uniref:nucleotidyltransferase domain-containing protein n=1 Tax=Actinocrinis sp. TaxID=1920516 RepID=UPI002D36AB7A
QDALLSAYALNSSRNRVLLEESVRLVELLRAHGVAVALRKGAYLAPAVYGDPGLRPMNDIDIFVERAQARAVAGVLEAEGYVAGSVDARGTIHALTRRQNVFWNVHVNNLPTFHRPGLGPIQRTVSVDVCFDLFLPASGSSLPAAVLLDEVVDFESCGVRVPVFRPEHFLLDVAAHLYKESTTLRYIEKLKHQRLLQYVDVVSLIAANPRLDWTVLLDAARTAHASRNVYFALANAEELFPGRVPYDVLARLAADGEVPDGFLAEYAAVDLDTPLHWSSSRIADRLFSDERPRAASRSPI